MDHKHRETRLLLQLWLCISAASCSKKPDKSRPACCKCTVNVLVWLVVYVGTIWASTNRHVCVCSCVCHACNYLCNPLHSLGSIYHHLYRWKQSPSHAIMKPTWGGTRGPKPTFFTLHVICDMRRCFTYSDQKCKDHMLFFSPVWIGIKIVQHLLHFHYYLFSKLRELTLQ